MKNAHDFGLDLAIGQLVVKNLHLLRVVCVVLLWHPRLNVLRDALQLLNEQQHVARGRNCRCRYRRRSHDRSSGSLWLRRSEPSGDVGRRGGAVCRNRSSDAGSLCLRYKVPWLCRLRHLLLLKGGLGRKRRLLLLLLLLGVPSLLLNLGHLLLLSIHLLLRSLLLLLLHLLLRRQVPLCCGLWLVLLLVQLLLLLLLLPLLRLLCVTRRLPSTKPISSRRAAALHPALILLLINSRCRR